MSDEPLKIAILGGGPSLAEAPIGDTSWIFWGMPWIPVPHLDLYFEPHADWRKNAKFYPCGDRPGALISYINEMTSENSPLLLPAIDPEIPNSVAYPFEDVDALSGGRYLESTVAYMLAFAALYTKPGDIVGLWGCDLATDSEYVYQRPNAEFWCGILRGRGVALTGAKGLSILRSVWSRGYYGAKDNVLIYDGVPGAVRAQIQARIDRRTSHGVSEGHYGSLAHEV